MGLESLHVRMARHVENGLAVARFLEEHPLVTKVHYPGLPSDGSYALAQKYLPKGGCGVVSFELSGGRKMAERFMKETFAGAMMIPLNGKVRNELAEEILRYIEFHTESAVNVNSLKVLHELFI
jgi:hypothetical protein